MRKIAILNFKGGTGKTTTAVNISHALALKRQSVLVVDCDPQGSIADWFGLSSENTFFDLLIDRVKLQDCIYQARKGLSVIPSDRRFPSMSILNVNALEYAKEVFMPVSMDYLSLRGVKQVIEALPKGVDIAKIIPTFYDQRTKKSKEILADLRSYFKGRVTKPIRVNVRLSECSSFHQTIFEYDPNSRGAVDYRRLAREVMSG